MAKSRSKRAGNQNNSSAKRVKQEDEKIEGNDDEGKNIMNPLVMTEVLPRILNYLDIKHLKETRLVCTLWRFEGGKFLLKRTNIQLKYFETESTKEKNIQLQIQLEEFLETTAQSQTFSVAIDRNYQPDAKNLKYVLPLLLQKTTALSYTPSRWNTRIAKATLTPSLKFFPNLQILNIHNDDLRTLSEEIPFFWTKLESLKEIRLLGPKQYVQQVNDAVAKNLLSKDALAVKEIHLQVSHNIPTLQRYLVAGFNWQIQKLTLELGELFFFEDLVTVRVFLDKISCSLKHLEWIIVHKELAHELSTPWTENSIMPLTLDRLETMKITVGRKFLGDSDWTWILFTCAIRLPNLKTLIMNKVPGSLEERIKEWNDHPKAVGRTLRSESLENLELIQIIVQNNPAASIGYEVPDKSYIVLSSCLWPNLKSLHVHKLPKKLPASFSLSEWINLERLDLKFAEMDKNAVDLWTKWLTGCDPKTSNQQLDAFTVKDLKNLKHLGISEHVNLKKAHIATDWFAQNSLKLMTQLQSLHLENSVMSTEGKEMLKLSLGPNVHIIIE